MKWVTMRHPKSGGVHVFPEKTQKFREENGWEVVKDDQSASSTTSVKGKEGKTNG